MTTSLAGSILDADYFQTNVILQSLVDGITNGALYGFLALTLVLVFRTSGQLNFAQGEMAMFGAFLVWQLNVTFDVGLWVAIPVAMIAMAIVAAVAQRTLLSPLRRHDWYASLIVLLGLFLLLNAAAAIIWGTSNRKGLDAFPSGLADQLTLRDGVPDVHVTYATLGIVATLLAVLGLLELLLRRTKIGLAYRAVTANPESAALVGIDMRRVVAIGWGIAGAVGVLVGVFTSQQSNLLHANLMLNALLFGFAAAALGGFDSLVGAVVGGLLVGLFEATIPNAFSVIGSELNVAVAFAVIFLVLLIRPSGLFGSEKVVRP